MSKTSFVYLPRGELVRFPHYEPVGYGVVVKIERLVRDNVRLSFSKTSVKKTLLSNGQVCVATQYAWIVKKDPLYRVSLHYNDADGHELFEVDLPYDLAYLRGGVSYRRCLTGLMNLIKRRVAYNMLSSFVFEETCGKLPRSFEDRCNNPNATRDVGVN